MSPKLQPLWQQLEKDRLELFKKLDGIDPSVLNRKPATDKWSVNQVLFHLIEAEGGSMRYIQKKLSFGTDIPKAGFRSAWRRFLLRVAFWLPIKFKAPKVFSPMPETHDYTTLRAHYAAQRIDLQEFLENLPDHLLDTELWKHVLAGKMTVLHMVDFMDDHFRRHRGQIERTLRQVG